MDKAKPGLISSYFSQPATSAPRQDSPIDLTGTSPDEDAPEMITAHRVKRVKLEHTDSARSISSVQPLDIAERSRLNHSQLVEQSSGSSHEVALRNDRHEALKRKLLADNSIFVRQRDEMGSENGESFDSHSDTSDSVDVVSGSRKLKGHMASNVGPSGQTWTPMELQVRRNPI